MRAVCVVVRDPFRPMHGRTAVDIRRRRKISSLAPRTSQPHIAILNGRAVLRASWGRRLQDGDSLAFIVLPQGDGGGGSNPLQVIAMLALVVFAPYAAAGIYAAAGGTLVAAGAATSLALIQAGVVIAGSMLVNALLPPPKPSVSQAGTIPSASPTYSLQAQGNSARLGNPIPVVYGLLRTYPDFGANPYTEFSGNDEYLYQLFVLSQGLVTVQDIHIADAVLDASPVNDGAQHSASGVFSEITYQIVPPGGTVSLFPSRVTTSADVSGQEATSGVALGPFPANPGGTQANSIAIDVVFSRGLYFALDNGTLASKTVTWTVEAAPINDAGATVGAFAVLGSESFTAATTTPQRKTYRYAVSLGRYTVRLTRTDTKDTSTRAGHEIDWFGLRASIPGSQTYGNVTLLALRMKASNQLSAASARKINCLLQRQIPVWNGSSWTTQASRSIAWAFADAAMNTTYGGGLPVSRLDLSGLLALDAVWTARGDNYDASHDTQATIWDALTQIARAGRAMPVYQGGILYAVRDSAQTLPVAMFTPRNIARGSLKIDYTLTTDDTTDAVEVSYFDGTVWSWQTVLATLPSGTSAQPAKVQMQGVTSRAQAWREGMYMAAANRYRRRMGTLQTELDGLIPRVGDLIAVSHDMPAWGSSGDVLAHTGIAAGSQITLSGTAVGSGTQWLALAAMDGSVSGPYQVSTQDGSNVVTLIDSIPSFSWPSYLREQTRYALGASSTSLYILARVLTVHPDTPELITLTFVVESGSVHTADGTGSPSAIPAWQLPGVPTVPTVTGLNVQTFPDDPTHVVLTWLSAPGAASYLVEASRDGVTWTRVAEVTGTSWTGVALYGSGTLFRVAGLGLVAGGWSSSVAAPIVAPAALASLTAAGGLFQIIVTWIFADSASYARAGVEIWASNTNDRTTASLLTFVRSPATSYTHNGLQPGQSWYYWARVADSAQNVSAWFPLSATGGVYAQPSTDASALLTQLSSAIGAAQLTTALQSGIAAAASLGSTYVLKVDAGGHVAGIGLISDATLGSAIVMLADKFLLLRPDGSGTPQQLFIAGSVNGTPTVGIDGALIVDGTIVARAIAAGSITADRIDTRGLTIKDASGTVIFGSGTALSVSRISGLGSLATASTVPAGSVTGLGSFATLSQINSTNISTYIAAAAIQTAQIANAAIGTAQIANAAVGTAQIANAAITNALIGNLQVDTAKIAGQAVTFSQATVGTGTTSAATSFTVTNTGAPYVVFYKFKGNVTTGSSGSASVSVAGSVVASQSVSVPLGSSAQALDDSGFVLLAAPTAGTSITLSGTVSASSGCSVSILYLETKR